MHHAGSWVGGFKRVEIANRLSDMFIQPLDDSVMDEVIRQCCQMEWQPVYDHEYILQSLK